MKMKEVTAYFVYVVGIVLIGILGNLPLLFVFYLAHQDTKSSYENCIKKEDFSDKQCCLIYIQKEEVCSKIE